MVEILTNPANLLAAFVAVLCFATIMTMITSLQVFAQPQLLTGGGPGNATLPLVMWIYNQGFKFQDLGLAAAGAWILFALIIAITASGIATAMLTLDLALADVIALAMTSTA